MVVSPTTVYWERQTSHEPLAVLYTCQPPKSPSVVLLDSVYGDFDRLICKRYGKQAVLELNCDYTKEELGEILAIIDSHGYLDRVTFISFIYSNLLRVRALYPDAEAQFLFTEYSDEILQRLTDDRIDAAIAHSSVNRIIIDKFHAAGLKVNCWIVDVSIVAEQLCFMGADYITTNILEQKTK